MDPKPGLNLSDNKKKSLVPALYVTNRKVAGLIPDGVIGISRRLNPIDCTVALGSIQPLIEMSTRNIF
jgi:hypothetical protein